MGITPLGVLSFYSHSKTKQKKFSGHQLLYFGDMFLNSISLDFCKKPRNVHFNPNSVFSLSYKIRFVDLRFLKIIYFILLSTILMKTIMFVKTFPSKFL